jgi:hypothetical protein
MLYFETRGRLILCWLLVSMGAMFPVGRANAQPRFEISMSKSLQSAANDSALASKEDAEAFLAQYLPIATNSNPKYRSGNGDVETQWITKAINFGTDENSNGIRVSMSEEVLEFRNGVRSAIASHQAEFSVEDVKISEREDSTDITENGEIALGIIFNCNSGKCIRTTYNGEPSRADWTDIYIQDASLRGRILKAFETLKRASGERGSRTDAKSP